MRELGTLRDLVGSLLNTLNSSSRPPDPQRYLNKSGMHNSPSTPQKALTQSVSAPFLVRLVTQ